MTSPTLEEIARRAEAAPHNGFIETHGDMMYLLSRLREAEADNARLREALRPFAKLADMTPIMTGRGENTRHRNPKDDEHFDWSSNVTWGMLRHARAALDEKEV